jgi:monofunctional glycosyltransferase
MSNSEAPGQAVDLKPLAQSPRLPARDIGVLNLLYIAKAAEALPRKTYPSNTQGIEFPVWPTPVLAGQANASSAPAISELVDEPTAAPTVRTVPPADLTPTPEITVQPLSVANETPKPPPVMVSATSTNALPETAPIEQPWPRRLLRYAGYAIAAYAALMLTLIVLFRFVNPPGSALMAWRAAGGTTINREWVPISKMSPNLVRAVIVAEDWTFCAHHGVDVAAVQDAIEKAGDGIPRGASTISMQTVKNVFLWPSKSYVRKAIEVPMTLVMEILWPKRRVLEVYLNIAEWGPGIFGAEAASQHHFNKPASKLTSREAAQLAASLPNPFVRDAGDPGPRLARKATTIQNRMRIAAGVTDCVGVISDSKAP